MLDHVPSSLTSRFVSEARRVLRPGGKLFVDMDAHGLDSYAHQGLQTEGFATRVRRALEASGFVLLRERPFCNTSAQLALAEASSGSCVRGNPTTSGEVDPLGGVAFVAQRAA